MAHGAPRGVFGGAGGGAPAGFARGLSLLRAKESASSGEAGGGEAGAKSPTDKEKALQSYLLGRNAAGEGAEPQQKRKRRKKKKDKGSHSYSVIDADESGALKGLGTQDDGGDDARIVDDGAVIVNEAEVEREDALAQRMRVIRSQQTWQTQANPNPAKINAGRHDSDDDDQGGDLSPRRSRPRMDSSDDEDQDLSPVRRRPRNDSSSDDASDLSPIRRRGGGEEQSRMDSEDEDLSPPRRQKESSETAVARQERKMGLIQGRELRDEVDQERKRRMEAVERMGPDQSGSRATTVYRDETGKKMTREEYEDRRDSKASKYERPSWGSGLVQQREREARIAEMERQATVPVSCSRFDAARDAQLRKSIRFGDPMAPRHPPNDDASSAKEHKNDDCDQPASISGSSGSGFVVPPGIPRHSWINRKAAAPPNRYDIKPGRHWDGVDRSTGFEKEYFKEINRQRLRDKTAFMWSQEDI
eukprot:CAMPEP_0198245498 /NCGR_PEP_ID=MMETSP1446-20131203/41379_1 /TAXON_ID=1461542 ORGANISM="Unidentified sp, Strain CCMP2111" /NCGR_SAMPLE_ID=MMETSP1446 /ASSEMBLY_ACC=CAM_ASM_001112 /LENGTH=473 /DNA_ID=CAMNT_0043929697 /DNA_START=64 /DNA_END=1485 /DNA_ORIENTATION=+